MLSEKSKREIKKKENQSLYDEPCVCVQTKSMSKKKKKKEKKAIWCEEKKKLCGSDRTLHTPTAKSGGRGN